MKAFFWLPHALMKSLAGSPSDVPNDDVLQLRVPVVPGGGLAAHEVAHLFLARIGDEDAVDLPLLAELEGLAARSEQLCGDVNCH
jgi:hypothetical protein